MRFTLRSTLFTMISIIGLSHCKSVPTRSSNNSELEAEKASNKPSLSGTPIHDIQGKPGNFGLEWEVLKIGFTETLAQLSGLYPNHDIYFVGREFEYLYDLSQLIASNPKQFSLINLNVTINLNIEERRKYVRTLIDERAAAAPTRDILLVDLGMGADGVFVRFNISNSAAKKSSVVCANPRAEGSRATIRTLLVGDTNYNSETANDIYDKLLEKLIEIPKSSPEISYFESSSVVTTKHWNDHKKEQVEGAIALKADLVASRPTLWKRFNSSYMAWRTVAGQIIKSGVKETDFLREVLKKDLNKSDRSGAEVDRLVSAGGRDVKSAVKLGLVNGGSSVSPPPQDSSPSNTPQTAPPASVPSKPVAGTEKNPSEYKSYFGLELKNGEFIKLPSGNVYRVEKYLDEGKRGRVYLIERNNQKYIIKLPKVNDADTLDSFNREKVKVAALAKHKMPHAAIIEEGPDYIVKDFVGGVRLKEHLITWQYSGFNKGDAKIEALQELLNTSIKKGVFIGDLNAKNLIWDGKGWTIIDTGAIEENLSEVDMLEKYLDQLTRRYGKVLTYNPEKSCKTILRGLIKRLELLKSSQAR